MPGIGTIHGFWASSQASAICAGVACLRSAIWVSSVDERQICLARLGSAKRGTVLRKSSLEKLGARVDRAGEEPLAERAERNEADPELLEGGQDRLLGLAPPQRVLALQGGDRLDGVGAADRLHAGLGQAEVADLALVDEVLDGAGDVLDRDVRVDAVLVEQVDRVGAQSLQRALDAAADRLGAAVERARSDRTLQVEPELRRDHDLVADRLERLADELLVGERAVDLRGVEEGDAAVDGGADQRDHLLLVRGRTEGVAHAHAPEADRRDLQAGSEGSLHHGFISLIRSWSGGTSLSVVERACGLVIRRSVFSE